MTLPTIVPVGYTGTTADFLHTKVDHSGAERASYGVVSIPASTVITTNVGMIPFNTGARLASLYAYIADLDTSTNVTCSIGYVYSDSTNNTDKPTAFVTGATTPQAGGSIIVNTPDVATWTATGDGWIVLQTGGGSTTTTGNLSYRVGLVYDTGGLPT